MSARPHPIRSLTLTDPTANLKSIPNNRMEHLPHREEQGLAPNEGEVRSGVSKATRAHSLTRDGR